MPPPFCGVPPSGIVVFVVFVGLCCAGATGGFVCVGDAGLLGLAAVPFVAVVDFTVGAGGGGGGVV